MGTIDRLGYSIIVEVGALNRIGTLVRDVASSYHVAVVTDDRVAPHYLARVEAALQVLESSANLTPACSAVMTVLESSRVGGTSCA